MPYLDTCRNCQKTEDQLTLETPWPRPFYCSEACYVESTTPAPGKPATRQIGSYYYPATITRVSPSGHKVWFIEDRPLGNGLFEPKVFTEPEHMATRRKDGQYAAVGCGLGERLYIGFRELDLDPHF